MMSLAIDADPTIVGIVIATIVVIAIIHVVRRLVGPADGRGG
jgi:hypothetical protein